MSLSNSYVITTSVSSNGTQPNGLTIDVDGLFTTKSQLKIQPNVNVLAFTVEPNLSANYEMSWPNELPAANQVLAINSTGTVQNWFNLEAPTTLVVRQNPTQGQFSRPSQAVTFVNTQANYNTTYTVWIYPGFYNELNTTSDLNYPMNFVGFGMNQTVIRSWPLRCNNSSNSSPIVNLSFQDLTFYYDFGNFLTYMTVRNDYSIKLKNIGLFGAHVPLITLGDFPYKPTYTYSLDINRLWYDDVHFPTNSISVLTMTNTSTQNTITSMVTLEDLRFNALNTGATTFFNFLNGSGTSSNIKDSWFSAVNATSSFGTVTSSGGLILKNCVFTQNMTNLLNFATTSFFNANAQMVVSQVDIPTRRDSYLLSTTTTDGNYPTVINDSDYSPYQTGTLSNRSAFVYPKYDREISDGLHQYTLYDDFTSPVSPFTDTIWQTDLIAGGVIGNTVTVTSTANVFRNCDIILDTTAANSAVAIYKGTNATPLTNGSYLRFESAVQPQSNFAAGSSPSFVIGLGDDISAQTNIDLAFANSAIYFGFGPDFTPSANWYAYTKSAGVFTRLDTSVPISTNLTTLEFDFKRSSSSLVDYYVNENLVGTISTNIPIGVGNISLTPIMKSTYSTGAGQVAVDYVSYYGRSNSMRRK